MWKKIKIGKSGIHGKGTLAKRDIKKGEIIGIMKGCVVRKVNKNIQDTLGNGTWIGFDEHHWVDAQEPFCFTNHSCNPNAGIKGTRTFVALKNIKKGEEITLDYSITEVDKKWYMKCFCKDSKCRGVAKSIYDLDSKLYNKYAPNIPTKIKNLYEKRRKSE